MGEDQEQQHRDQSRDHHHADDDAVHEAWRTLPAKIDQRLRRRLIPNVFTAWGANTTGFKDTAPAREYLESVTLPEVCRPRSLDDTFLAPIPSDFRHLCPNPRQSRSPGCASRHHPPAFST